MRKIIILLLSIQSLHAGSVFDDFRRDLPAIWKCWSQRYMGNEEDHSERPLTMEGNLPVILVHGYLHTNTGWTQYRKALEKARLGPVYVPRLEASAQDIRRSAYQIANVIELVKEETGHDQVVLVGHSMGGVVCAYCTQHLAPEGSVKAVITLGSPLRGTKTAMMGFGKAAQQMQTKNRFLQNLTAQMTYHPKTIYFSFASKADPIVRPYNHAFYKEPDDDIHFHLYHDVGHMSFLFDEDVIEDVISMIHTLDEAGGGDHS